MRKHFTLMFLGAILLLAGCTAAPNDDGQGGTGSLEGSSGILSSLNVNIDSEYNVGQSAILSNQLKITVNSVKIATYYTYYSDKFSKVMAKLATSDKKFVIFDVNVKNVAETPLTIESESFSLADDRSNFYDLSTYGENEDLSFGQIAPGITNSGKILFEVPDTVVDTVFLYDLNSLFDINKRVAFVYDSSTVTDNEVIDADLSITNVDYTSSSIKYIFYTIKNTGNIGFMPIIDYSVSVSSDVIRSSTKDNPFDIIIQVDETANEQIAAHIPISGTGTYTINFELSDKASGETIKTISKEVVIG